MKLLKTIYILKLHRRLTYKLSKNNFKKKRLAKILILFVTATNATTTSKMAFGVQVKHHFLRCPRASPPHVHREHDDAPTNARTPPCRRTQPWTENRLFARIIGTGAACADLAESIVRHHAPPIKHRRRGRKTDEQFFCFTTSR